MFKKEADGYAKLKDCQGDIIPTCYGGYTINFPDRELDEDKNVNLLLVERIRGKRLSEIKVWETTDEQKEQIWNQVRAIMDRLKTHGILLPEVQSKQFVLQNHSRRLFVTNFIGTIYDGEEVRLTRCRQEEVLEEICSEIGYVPKSEEIG